MHGTIEVKSKLGEGSTFTVRIPCRISLAGGTEPTAFDETAAWALSGCRILLAEDNDLNAEISIELLTREGSFWSNGQMTGLSPGNAAKAPERLL